MSTSVLLIDKTGTIKSSQIKDYKESELYKKAGFKTSDGFALQHVWPVTLQNISYRIHVYAKTQGRAGQENKYDFPPPIDTTLFFGTCVLVNKPEDETVGNLSVKQWEAIYEYLFGGFENIGSEDSELSEDEEEEEGPRTKEGYLKDGFIVDDDEEEDSDYSESCESEKKGKRRQAFSSRKPVKRNPKSTVAVEPLPVVAAATAPVNVFDCTVELIEEEYV